MAPEAIFGSHAVDRRSDVYAIGCVAYFLLTGRLVFDANTAMEMIWHHLHTEPVAPSLRTERTISREVDELVLACLHKNPRRRPQDAAELSCRMAGVRSGAWNQSAARSWWELPSCPAKNICPSEP